MLECEDPGLERELFAAAREVKTRMAKTETLPRALIECSNRCEKNCRYCGIRAANRSCRRYTMSVEEVENCIKAAKARGFKAVALQAGEIGGEENCAYYERILKAARGLEVTLSLGEQEEAVYRRWRKAGALRYLLRIETSDRELYAKIHPAECSFDRRLGCLRALKRLGFVTGSGVMTGLPGQTAAMLARDIVFFGEEKLDMIGLGPYIPHPASPLEGARPLDEAENARLLALTLRMLALTRLYLHRVNMVAATSLSVLDPSEGRERAIAAGANVIMPDFTPREYCERYDLYPGKAGVDICV